MKQKNTDLVTSILLSVFAVILMGIIIYSTKNFFDSTADAADNVTENTQELTIDYEDYDISMYDGEEVRGSEVVNFIKKQLGDYSEIETAPIYTQVKTTVLSVIYTNTYTNNVHISDIKNFSSSEFYIKPTALFIGKVIKSKNKAILGVTFIQK